MAAATPTMRRYIRVTMVAMSSYVVMNAVAMTGVLDHLAQASRLAFSVFVALPVSVQIWATIVCMRDSDEFMRALMAKRFIIAAGAAFAFFSAWGFAEGFADAPHAPGWLVYPLFWALYALVTPFVRSSH